MSCCKLCPFLLPFVLRADSLRELAMAELVYDSTLFEFLETFRQKYMF